MSCSFLSVFNIKEHPLLAPDSLVSVRPSEGGEERKVVRNETSEEVKCLDGV